jgi:trimeric autotransporter adhesin
MVKHVKFHLNRFLRRVRIHGGEFDTSARAMYREGVTSSLRADLRIVRRSTIERKQMSTKTTFKRIALVTVAALGFGVMSVAPSNAAINADTLTLSSATAAQTTAETATATSAVVTVSFLGATSDSMSVTASLVSAPAGNTALPILSLTETSSATIDGADEAVGYAVAANTGTRVIAGDSTKVTTAKFRVFLATGGVSLGSAAGASAPAVAGTYVVKLTPAAVGGLTLAASTAQTLTITVTEAPALDKVITTATSILTAGTFDSGTADAVVTASKTLAASTPGAFANAKANIKITPKNAAATTVGTASNPGESMTAVITGPGSLGTGAWGSGDSLGRAISVKAGHFVYVYADGNSGVSTITISSKAGVVLATETVTFFGAATSITTAVEASVLNPTAAGTTLEALAVTVKDAAGVVVSNLNAGLYVTSETTSIVSNSYAKSCTFDTTDQVYYCDLTGVAAGKTKITVGTKSSATDTTVGALNATAVEVRVGTQTAASVKVTTDKASYAPGEKATLTVQLLDADGAVNADGIYNSIFAAGGITSDFVLGTGSETLTATKVEAKDGTDAIGGKRAYTIYMPQNTGTITFSWTTGGTAVTGTAPTALTGLAVANQAVKGTLAVSVSNPGVDAAAAAAEEATAAANDATDAALSAAEAAEAATAMAQEAVDAVAELSASVTKLISALRAQITTLTNLVVKIQKKVKA